MKLPIILLVLDEKVAYLYSDIEYLECDLEAIDVQNGNYEVYDAEAKLLKLTIIKKKGIELVKIEETSTTQANLQRVCDFLWDTLNYREVAIENEHKEDLDYLIEKNIEYFGTYPLPIIDKEKRLNILFAIIFLIVIGSISLIIIVS